ILGAEFLILLHDPVSELLAVQRQHALNSMLGHKIDTAATGYRLPDLHRAMDGARHQGNLAQLIAAIRHPWRQRVMLPLMGERLLVERSEDDFHLLFEELHIGGVVQHGRPKRFYFARMITTANAKD